MGILSNSMGIEMLKPSFFQIGSNVAKNGEMRHKEEKIFEQYYMGIIKNGKIHESCLKLFSDVFIGDRSTNIKLDWHKKLKS